VVGWLGYTLTIRTRRLDLTPGCSTSINNYGHVVHAHVPLSLSSIIWNSAARKVTASLTESNGKLPLWLCWLNSDWDQLSQHSPALVSSIWHNLCVTFKSRWAANVVCCSKPNGKLTTINQEQKLMSINNPKKAPESTINCKCYCKI